MWFERRAALAAVLLIATLRTTVAAPSPDRIALLRFDPAHTVVGFRLAGSIHDTHGAFALKEGSFRVDPSSGVAEGLVVIDAVSGQSGNSSRDSRMRDVVLEAGQYPEIRFRPAKLDGSLAPDGSFRAQLHGTLSLHGVDHEVSMPVEGHVGADAWGATGHFSVPYVAWGLPDPSVLFLTVAKEVELEVNAAGDVRWTTDTKGALP